MHASSDVGQTHGITRLQADTGPITGPARHLLFELQPYAL